MLAGCGPTIAVSSIEAEACALLSALQNSWNLKVYSKHIFLANNDLLSVIYQDHRHADWRLASLIENIRNLLQELLFPQIHIIPLKWLKPAATLAIFGSSMHALTLYHHGRDLPH